MNRSTRLGLPLLVIAPVMLLAASAPQAQDDSAAAPEPKDETAAPPPAVDDDFDRTPRDCVPLFDIDTTKVVDDQTILFYMHSGRKVYRNYLPRTCHDLERENRFGYKTANSRLCDSDMITVLEQFGVGLREGFTCRLGDFLPITREEADDLLLAKQDLGRMRNSIRTKRVDLPPDQAPAAEPPGAQDAGAPPAAQDAGAPPAAAADPPLAPPAADAPPPAEETRP